MKKFFFVLAMTFGILLIANIAWIGVNIYMFLIHGIESVVTGETLIENIYLSLYLRWILLCDGIWIVACLCFGLGRKSYDEKKQNVIFSISTDVESYKIFNMYKVPKKCKTELTNELDNVNAVRFALSCATNTNLKLLKRNIYRGL
mgnify:CR=1 FL=1